MTTYRGYRIERCQPQFCGRGGWYITATPEGAAQERSCHHLPTMREAKETVDFLVGDNTADVRAFQRAVAERELHPTPKFEGTLRK